MKTASIQDLKSRLSALLSQVASGARILITKHRRPVAMLTPPESDHLHVGSRCGRGRLEPLLDRATQGRYLQILDEDRAEG